MKLAFMRAWRLLCVPFKYIFCGLLILSVTIVMTCQVVPIAMSVLIDYMQFTTDAPLAALLFMGGVPGLFLAGLMLYGTIKFLNKSCRCVCNYFDGAIEELDRKLALHKSGGV